MSNPDKFYITPEPSDSNSFGCSVAINERYLVVGDPGANHVIVYTRQPQGQWQRSRAIYPPENFIPYDSSNGFGLDIKLENDSLMISAIALAPPKIENTNSFPGGLISKYFIHLDSEQEVQPIDVPAFKSENHIQFYILSEGKPKLVRLPEKNEEYFGTFIASYENLVLVGSPSRHLGGKGWLFDLNTLEDTEPIELTIPTGCMGDTVAISEEFAVVGNRGIRGFIEDPFESDPKTLIMSLKNGSTRVIDSEGELSLDGNILAVMLPPYRLHMQPPKLQLFRLEEDATPHLILERKFSKDDRIFGEKYLVQAWVQSGWLITVNRFNDGGATELCLESIEQIASK